MPDITLCANDTCPIRARCRRATTEPSGDHQSYARFEYATFGDGRALCVHWIPNTVRERRGWERRQT